MYYQKFVLIFISLISVFCCLESKSDTFPKTPGDADSQFKYGNPIFIERSDYSIIPISLPGGSSKKSFSYSRGYSSILYWNIIFYNHQSERVRFLTEKKVMISTIMPNLKNTGPILKTRILYKVRNLDYNKDKILDMKDPEFLFSSSVDGTGFKQISPLIENLEHFTIIPEKDIILFKTRKDTNQDFKFDKKDSIRMYKLDLRKNGDPVEILNSDANNKIHQLFDNLWTDKN